MRERRLPLGTASSGRRNAVGLRRQAELLQAPLGPGTPGTPKCGVNSGRRTGGRGPWGGAHAATSTTGRTAAQRPAAAACCACPGGGHPHSAGWRQACAPVLGHGQLGSELARRVGGHAHQDEHRRAGKAAERLQAGRRLDQRRRRGQRAQERRPYTRESGPGAHSHVRAHSAAKAALPPRPCPRAARSAAAPAAAPAAAHPAPTCGRGCA